MEYGDAKEGYWISDKFIKQIKEVAKIKFPDAGWKIFWILATAVATLNERQSWRQTIVYMLPKYHRNVIQLSVFGAS